jgi:hypothetical protein
MYTGLDGVGRADGIEVNQLGIKKNIVMDHIYDIGYIDDDEFHQQCIEKERQQAIRKIKAKYQGITDDRFNQYEPKVFGESLREKDDFYKGKLMPSDFRNNGFAQRSLAVRQNTNVWEKGQEPFKQKILESTIHGRKNTDKDLQELNHGMMYGVDNVQFRKAKGKEGVKQAKGIKFSSVLEEDIRDLYGLQNGNRKNSVIDYVDKAYQDFTKNELNCVGNNYSGKYQGGFMRRSMVDDVANIKKDDYYFDIAPKQVETDSYYYDYGWKKIADDVITELFDDHEEDNDNILNIKI